VSIEVIPLGTASAIPANGRHLSSFAVRREGRVLLFDCGEGTQYRLAPAGIRWSRIDAVFISHFHGDHLFGLMGLMSTMALLGRTTPLALVGPAGLRRMLEVMPGLAPAHLPYDVEYVEVGPDLEDQRVYEGREFAVNAAPLAHRVFAMGFRLQESPRRGRVDASRAQALGVAPGQIGRLVRGEAVSTAAGRVVEPSEVVGPARRGLSVAYCLDTVPCEGAARLAQGADLLIHESTFAEVDSDRAERTAHSTARQAAETARDADARRLLLTHFSARYDDLSPLLAEARAIFPRTDLAEELVPVTVRDT
jgi:ribonuclease Z